MATYNFIELEKDPNKHLESWAFVEMLTLAYPAEEFPDVFNSKNIEIKTTFNGIEIDPFDLIRLMNDQLDRIIEQAIHEKIEEISGNIKLSAEILIEDFTRELYKSIGGDND